MSIAFWHILVVAQVLVGASMDEQHLPVDDGGVLARITIVLLQLLVIDDKELARELLKTRRLLSEGIEVRVGPADDRQLLQVVDVRGFAIKSLTIWRPLTVGDKVADWPLLVEDGEELASKPLTIWRHPTVAGRVFAGTSITIRHFPA